MDVGMAEAGQSCDEPLHREEEGRPHQDVLAEILAYGDQPLADGTLTLMDQDATQGSLDDFWSMWQRAGLLWHVWQVAGAPGGATSCSVDGDYALTGPTSPFRGLTSLISSFWHFSM
jgi:hypothetical protein